MGIQTVIGVGFSLLSLFAAPLGTSVVGGVTAGGVAKGAAQQGALKQTGAVPASNKAPKITEVRVDKSDHTLQLMEGDVVHKTYTVALGPGGLGPKRYEGDMTTPTGRYVLRGRFGLYHQFINVSYPNDEDRERYKNGKKDGSVPAGKGIGFGIGLHGVGKEEWNGVHKLTDWTAGCIAVDNQEIDEISKLVPDGTPIVIQD